MFASEANIGRVSNRMTKLWNAKEFVDNVNKKLAGKKYSQKVIDKYILASKYFLLFAQMNIDAAKNMFIPKLPEATEALMEETAPEDGKKPYWFRFSTNFKTNEANRDKNEQERDAAVLTPNNSVCNRICQYVDNQMRTRGILDGKNRACLDLSGFRGYDYKILYGDDSNTKRHPEIIDIWKHCCQMFSYSRIKKETAKAAAEHKTSSDKIRMQYIFDRLYAAGYNINEIYYTLVDYLFRDNPFATSCGSNKYFWVSPCGEKAAQIIEQNVKSGDYDKEGSYVDKFRKCCPCCGQYYTPSSLYVGGKHGRGLCPICSAINFDKYHAKNNNKARDEKAAAAEDKRIPDFIRAVRAENITEDKFIEFVYVYNKSNKKIKQSEIPSIAANLGFDKIAMYNIDKIKYLFQKLKGKK